MTSLRDDLRDVFDSARQVVDDLGFRQRSVVLRTLADAGADDGTITAALTAQTPTDLVLTPTPRVHGNAKRIEAVFGNYENGDVMVDKVSPNYTRAQLDPGDGNPNHPATYLVDCTVVSGTVTDEGDRFRLHGIEKRNSEWRLHLRRMRTTS